jgi:hypothetical protein
MSIAKEHRKAKLLPIIGHDGKIRIASIHSAPVVWAARAMTSFLMPLLKDISITRDILRDREITLTGYGQEPKILYSADLSKATDPISVELSRYVLNETTKLIEPPEWWEDALDGTINSHIMSCPDGSQFTSVCGALMGLGPGWFVLCILNAFCAWRAGAGRKSLAICGDDLIGLWTREQADRYEANLELLGLKANTSKSFRSEHSGVFCERYVRKLSPDVARSQKCLRLGEAVAAKARAGGGALGVIDTLKFSTKGEKLRRVAQIAADKLGLRNTQIPGPLAEGGSGFGRVDMSTVLSYFLFGPVSLTVDTSKKETKMKQIRSELRHTPLGGKGETVAISDVLVEAKTNERFDCLRRTSKAPPPPQNRKMRDVQKDLRKRESTIKDLFRTAKGRPLKALALALDKRHYVLSRPRLLCSVRRFIRLKRFDLALWALKKSWDVHIDVTTAQRLLSAVPSSKRVMGLRTNLNLLPLGGWSSNTVAK